jgi:hypothetical protein
MIKVKLLKIDVIVIGVNSHHSLPQILAKKLAHPVQIQS